MKKRILKLFKFYLGRWGLGYIRRFRVVKDVKLPKYPSELLQLALDDIEVIGKDKRYHIDIRRTHQFNLETKKCHVSLIGSVLANTLKADNMFSFDYSLKHIEGKYGAENRRKLLITDYLQLGAFRIAYSEYKKFFCYFDKELTDEEEAFLKQIENWARAKAKKINQSDWLDICNFKNLKLAENYYSSIVEQLACFEDKVLGKNTLLKRIIRRR